VQAFLDHLASAVGPLGANGACDIQLIGLLDAIAARLPGDMDLAQEVFAAGREHLCCPDRLTRPGLALASRAENADAPARVRPEPAEPTSRWTSPTAPAANPGQVFADLLMLGAPSGSRISCRVATRWP
jgi:hypothetical protein